MSFKKQLQTRARLLAQIRDFFKHRNVLEVETPLLCQHTVTDVHIASFATTYQNKPFHLQTSPEYAMKRLLVAGCGDIYQLCKAFRDGEAGRQHNPEFTLLEWYRTGFDHHALMSEVDDLIQAVLGTKKAKRKTYTAAFEDSLNINPHTVPLSTLTALVKQQGIDFNAPPHSQAHDQKNLLLDSLFSHTVGPKLGWETPVFLYDYPAPQAALAKIRSVEGHPFVAERFELFIRGMEIANGYHELTDADEQHNRFQADNATRKRLGLVQVTEDERFLRALARGLPKCAGVALGVDRLLLLASHSESFSEVMPFTIDNA